MTTKKPETPLVAVDTVVFGVIEDHVNVLLIKINEGPYKDKWAVPGGLVKMNESLDSAATRVLETKTSLKDIYLEQLYTFGDPKRDKRGRAVSVSYFVLASDPKSFELKTLKYYSDIKWFSINDLPETAFDHKEIIEKTHERLKGKLEYSNIAYSLLPNEFTLSQLQRIYEIVLGKVIDKRNFRKKIKSLDLLQELNKTQKSVTHRPAKLYKFKQRKLRVF